MPPLTISRHKRVLDDPAWACHMDTNQTMQILLRRCHIVFKFTNALQEPVEKPLVHRCDQACLTAWGRISFPKQDPTGPTRYPIKPPIHTSDPGHREVQQIRTCPALDRMVLVSPVSTRRIIYGTKTNNLARLEPVNVSADGPESSSHHYSAGRRLPTITSKQQSLGRTAHHIPTIPFSQFVDITSIAIRQLQRGLCCVKFSESVPLPTTRNTKPTGRESRAAELHADSNTASTSPTVRKRRWSAGRTRRQ